MITTLVDALFGCWHKNYSFPITAKRGERRSAAASITGTYVVCLDCGKEFPYSWQEMKVVTATAKPAGKLAHAAESYAGK
jgi:predicted transcriptional regulator